VFSFIGCSAFLVGVILLFRCWHKNKVLFCWVWHGHCCTEGCRHRKWTRLQRNKPKY